jgi:SAM-dependent methyltransferase
MEVDPKRLVEQGYDHMAERYLESKDPHDPVTLAALEEMARMLRPGAAVLDLGCGPGVPATRWLQEHGYQVTGVDISTRQLMLARQQVPGAFFRKADMTALEYPPAAFDAVVSFYAIIHVPRSEQLALMNRIHDWLKPGGIFLTTMSIGSWEGSEPDWEGWGAPMWWSHYGRDENLNMMRSAGFEIISAEVRTGTFVGEEEKWLWVLAIGKWAVKHNVVKTFFSHLRLEVPEFEPVYRKHLRDNDEVLSYVLMGDVVRFVYEAYRQSVSNQADAKYWGKVVRISLALLEEAIDPSHKELVDVVWLGFVENMTPSYKEDLDAYLGIKAQLGPKLREVLNYFDPNDWYASKSWER